LHGATRSIRLVGVKSYRKRIGSSSIRAAVIDSNCQQRRKWSAKTRLFTDRKVFLKELKALDKKESIKLVAAELKAILSALSQRDEDAAICRNSKGEPEPDCELRDTESVPLKEDVEEYFQREVVPHVPEAWIDESKEKVGCLSPAIKDA